MNLRLSVMFVKTSNCYINDGNKQEATLLVVIVEDNNNACSNPEQARLMFFPIHMNIYNYIINTQVTCLLTDIRKLSVPLMFQANVACNYHYIENFSCYKVLMLNFVLKQVPCQESLTKKTTIVFMFYIFPWFQHPQEKFQQHTTTCYSWKQLFSQKQQLLFLRSYFPKTIMGNYVSLYSILFTM